MRFTPDNHYIMGLWLAARQGNGLPQINAATFTRDTRVNKNICLEFMTSDGSVRFAYAGGTVEGLLNADLAGTPTTSIYRDSERKQLSHMQHTKFVDPFIILSLSSTTTQTGENIQVELLQLPFVSVSTNETLYVIGAFERKAIISDTDRAGMVDRKLLSRTIFDLETLKPIDNEFTYPPAEGKTTAKTASRTAELT